MAGEVLFEKVLLIEDEPAHAMLVRRALKDMAGEVVEVATAEMCRNELAAGKFELVVSDLNLPDSSHGAHVRSLAQNYPDLPVLILTSSSSLNDAVEAMRSGARDYLVKDFDENFGEVLKFTLARIKAAQLLASEKIRLEREMRVLRIAIENSHDGLAVVDSEGLVLYANHSFEQFAGLCGGDGRSLNGLFTEKVATWQTLNQSVQHNLLELPEGSVWNAEVTFVDRPNTAFDLSLSVIKTNESDTRRACVVWLRDISDQKKREKFQREILSTTTHDLKGPLGAIIISSELLQELVKDQDRAREIALRVGSSAHSAVNLIDEFLSARRIQEGNFILKPVRLNLTALIKTVLEDYSTIAVSRGITLQNLVIEKAGEQSELFARVDKLGFSRVLGNLLSNALKFTPRGGKVTVDLKQLPDSFKLIVSDTGSGMEPSGIAKIFERFSRLEQHSQTAGTGLGLFVVKSIVSAHGGTIEVTSGIGVGTSFSIRWPLDPPVNDRGELICLDFN